MVNFCYAYPIIYDNDGKPLRGRLDFCEPGTTTPKNVFDVNGNSLGASIDTTDEGFPGESQIFINGATDCRVYKGVELQYLMRLVDVSAQGGTPSGGGTSVSTIEDLRGLSVPEDGTTVTSTGYYAAGDMTPQFYVFSASSTAEDDGGGVVKPDSVEASAAGRWLLVPQKYIDCRAFGIMPVDSLEGDPDSYSPVELFTFAGAVGRDVWFPSLKTASYSYYILTAGTYACSTKIHADKGVRFRNTSSSNTVGLTASGIESAGMKFDYGTFNVTCPIFRTSWKGANATVNYTVLEKLVVDSAMAVTASGVRVEFLVEVTNSVSLTGCEIVCDGKLSTAYAHAFTDCRVTDRYFTNPSSIDMSLLTLSGCRLDIDDFASVDNWAKFNMSQGNGYLDFKNKIVASLNVAISSCVVSNAFITSLAIQSTCQNAEFRNCTIGGMSSVNGNLILKDCHVTLTNSVTVNGAVHVSGGSVTTSNGSEFWCSASAVFDRVDISAEVFAVVVNAYDCRVGKPVTVTGSGNIFSCVFTGNIFYGDGTCVLDSETGAVAISCIWKDNHFGGAAMGVTLADFANANTHTYTYEGNTGNCVPTAIKNVAATSKQAFSMTKGWKVAVGFPQQTLFILGAKEVRIAYHAHVGVTGCTLESSNYFTAISGSSVTMTVENGALVFPDITTESPFDTTIKDVAIAYPNTIKAYADVEVV